MPIKRRKRGGSYAGISPYNDPMAGEGAKEFFRGIGNFFKNSKIISKGLTALGSVLPAQYGAIAGTAGSIASQLGIGRRRRRVVRRPVGGSKTSKKRGAGGSGSVLGIQMGVNGGKRRRARR